MQFCREISIVVAMNSEETTTKSKPKPSHRCFGGPWMYYFLLGSGPSFFFSHLICFLFSSLPFFSCLVGPLAQPCIWLGQHYPVGLATWLGFSPFSPSFLFFTCLVGPVVPRRLASNFVLCSIGMMSFQANN